MSICDRKACQSRDEYDSQVPVETDYKQKILKRIFSKPSEYSETERRARRKRITKPIVVELAKHNLLSLSKGIEPQVVNHTMTKLSLLKSALKNQSIWVSA